MKIQTKALGGMNIIECHEVQANEEKGELKRLRQSRSQ